MLDEPETAKFGTNFSLKHILTNRSIFKQTLCILGAKMEPNSNEKSMFFLIDFLEPPKTSRNHRVSSGRGGHFLPAGSPEAANCQRLQSIKNKQMVHHII